MAYLDFNIEDYIFKDEKYFYLYKHLRVDNGSLNVISQPSLKFTSPTNFNDPFDCSFLVDFKKNFSIKELKERFGKRIATHNVIDWIKAKQRLLGTWKNQEYDKDFTKNLGVCCLNQNPLSLLMWSHYADFHKGFMVELRFPINSEELIVDFIPFRVRYSEDYPTVDMTSTHLTTEKDIERTLFTKALEWNYEKEFRILGVNKSGIIEDYPQKYLSSVILGVNTSKENKRLIKSSLDRFNEKFRNGMTKVELFSAEKVNCKYQVHVPRHQRLDKKFFKSIYPKDYLNLYDSIQDNTFADIDD